MDVVSAVSSACADGASLGGTGDGSTRSGNGTVGLGAMGPAVKFQALSKTEFHENEGAGVLSAGVMGEALGSHACSSVVKTALSL
jgi:hypothetical protein